MTGFIIVLVCVGGSIAWGLYAGNKRRDDIGILAKKLGLQCTPEKDDRVVERYAFLNRLNKSSNRYARNFIEGTFRKHEIAAFDYQYETSGRTSKGYRQTDPHHFSYFILKLEKNCPKLTIARKGLLLKFVQTAGHEEIDVDAEDFAKHFTVRSEDEAFASAFCNERMRAYLLLHPDLNIEVDRNILAIGFNHRLKAQQFETRLNELVEIRDRMPHDLFDS